MPPLRVAAELIVGLSAGFTEIAVTWAEPFTYPARMVVIVAVDEVLAATPLTVTRPVFDIATVPPAVAVPP